MFPQVLRILLAIPFEVHQSLRLYSYTYYYMYHRRVGNLAAAGMTARGAEIVKRHDVINLLNAHRYLLATEHGVRRLSLFGSVARDAASDISDVDLLVEFDRPVGLFGLFELQDHLEQLLGCPVDVNTPDSLKPRLRSRVLAERMDVWL